MTRNRFRPYQPPPKLNGANRKESKHDPAHKAHGSIEKTVNRDNTTSFVPSAHVALVNDAEAGPDDAPYVSTKVIKQALEELRGEHVGPFLKNYHHVLDAYRQKKKQQRKQQPTEERIRGFISKAQKHTYLYSNADAPRPRKTWFTTTVLWLVKIYAYWMGGLLSIPESCTRGGHPDNHGKKSRFGLSQLFNEVPGFGSATNTGPALFFYLWAGLHLGLPLGTLMHVLGIRVYSGGVGALGPVPALWGEPFMASKLQAELRIANIIETWIDLRSRTEHDTQLAPDDPLYDRKHGHWRSEELSKIFYKASDGQIQDATYSNDFRKKIWGHYM